jgi:hypothetical protein
MNTYHRFYVETRFKLGITAEDIFDELSKVHADTAPALQTYFG